MASRGNEVTERELPCSARTSAETGELLGDGNSDHSMNHLALEDVLWYQIYYRDGVVSLERVQKHDVRQYDVYMVRCWSGETDGSPRRPIELPMLV